MTDTKEMWTIEELVELTEVVQTKEIEYSGKTLIAQWCELTEAEEPKMTIPDSEMSDEDKNTHYAKIAGKRVLAMIKKANEKNPDGAFINNDSWVKLPTTLRWKVANTVMKTETTKVDF